MGQRLKGLGLAMMIICVILLVVMAPTGLDGPNWPLLGGLAAGAVLGGMLALAGR